MLLRRRTFLQSGSAALALPYLARGAWAAVPGAPLPIPDLVEAGSAVTEIGAAEGVSTFVDGVQTWSWGYSRDYLGPTLRFTRGSEARMAVRNALSFPVTAHWHGLHVDSIHDGGPQLPIRPGETWDVPLAIDQPGTTLWYHSHIHGATSEHVYGGLAGMIQLWDPAAEAGLPQAYGIDDLPVILQDRAFSESGAFAYAKRGPTVMHGFRGDTVLVNGAVVPRADVPQGVVRLRLLNGSNARIWFLRFSDDRTFHKVATDGGRLPAPVAMRGLILSPGERAEVLVDFSDGRSVSLLSGPDPNAPGMGGMMMGMMPGDPPQSAVGAEGEFDVMTFRPDPAKPVAVAALPERVVEAPVPDLGPPTRTRDFALAMHGMTINGVRHDMARIDFGMRRGETELWRVTSDQMAHPFHVHGTSFLPVRLNGRDLDPAEVGLKDVFLVVGTAEFLVRLDHSATREIPFMYHCHILEHEDAGMMGQFTVT